MRRKEGKKLNVMEDRREGKGKGREEEKSGPLD